MNTVYYGFSIINSYLFYSVKYIVYNIILSLPWCIVVINLGIFLFSFLLSASDVIFKYLFVVDLTFSPEILRLPQTASPV